MNLKFQKRETERARKWLEDVKKGYKLKIIQLEKAEKYYNESVKKLKEKEDESKSV